MEREPEPERERELEPELERDPEREPKRELEPELEPKPMSKRPITFTQWAKRYGIAKLAKDVGVCRTTPYKWLSGVKPPGYYTAILIQAVACRDFVELTVEEIMGGKK